ncbi:hypothetical protein GCM10022221_46490 [Actinocorallia aurea]
MAGRRVSSGVGDPEGAQAGDAPTAVSSPIGDRSAVTTRNMPNRISSLRSVRIVPAVGRTTPPDVHDRRCAESLASLLHDPVERPCPDTLGPARSKPSTPYARRRRPPRSG